MAENISEALYLLLIGMGVVSVALVALQMFVNGISLLERGISRLFNRPEAQADSEPAAAAPARQSLSDLADEEAAVIAAAVAAASSQHVVVHHVRLLQDGSPESWSRVGRLDIMRSHSLSQKK